MLTTKITIGEDITPHIKDLAKLRIEVFKEFPYLYDGNLAYEQKYLQTYSKAKNSFFFLVLDNQNVVGASTGIPLQDETQEVKKPFQEADQDIKTIFYFGESVLSKDYRGKGLGNRFFEERIKFASTLPEIKASPFVPLSDL